MSVLRRVAIIDGQIFIKNAQCQVSFETVEGVFGNDQKNFFVSRSILLLEFFAWHVRYCSFDSSKSVCFSQNLYFAPNTCQIFVRMMRLRSSPTPNGCIPRFLFTLQCGGSVKLEKSTYNELFYHNKVIGDGISRKLGLVNLHLTAVEDEKQHTSNDHPHEQCLPLRQWS